MVVARRDAVDQLEAELDVFNRMIVGWARVHFAAHRPGAGRARKWACGAGQDVTALTHHPYRGVQDRAVRYTERLAAAEAVALVGSRGESYNAMAEALNSLFKAECVRNPVMGPKGGWKSVGDVEIAVAKYVY